MNHSHVLQQIHELICVLNIQWMCLYFLQMRETR